MNGVTSASGNKTSAYSLVSLILQIPCHSGASKVSERGLDYICE